MTKVWWKGALAALALLLLGAPPARADQSNICSTSTGLCQVEQWTRPGRDCWCPSSRGPVTGRIADIDGPRGGLGAPVAMSTLCNTNQGACTLGNASPIGSNCWCTNSFGLNVAGQVVATQQGGQIQPPPITGRHDRDESPRMLNEFQENALKDGCPMVFANDPGRLRSCLKQQDRNWRDALARGCQHRYSGNREKLAICMDF